jgi:hypothetical protein
MQENQTCECNESFCKGTSVYKKARKQPDLPSFWRLSTRVVRLQPCCLHFKWTPRRMHFLDPHPRPRHPINCIIQCPHMNTQQTIFLCATSLKVCQIGIPPSMIRICIKTTTRRSLCTQKSGPVIIAI